MTYGFTFKNTRLLKAGHGQLTRSCRVQILVSHELAVWALGMAPRILKVAEVPRVLSIQSHTVCTGGASVRGGAARGRSLPSACKLVVCCGGRQRLLGSALPQAAGRGDEPGAGAGAQMQIQNQQRAVAGVAALLFEMHGRGVWTLFCP